MRAKFLTHRELHSTIKRFQKLNCRWYSQIKFFTFHKLFMKKTYRSCLFNILLVYIYHLIDQKKVHIIINTNMVKKVYPSFLIQDASESDCKASKL